MSTRFHQGRLLWVALPATVGLCACGGASPGPATTTAALARPEQRSSAVEPRPALPRSSASSPATSPSKPASEWLEQVLLDHPLVGRIYAPAREAFATRAELDDAVLHAPYVLLGEKHDNQDHHRLQADLLDELLRARHGVVVAFEMVDTSQQRALDQYLAGHLRDVDGLARVLRWSDSGWPDWSMYRPLFATAVKHDARIVAANLPRQQAMEIAQQGRAAPELAAMVLPTLPPAEVAAMEQEMREAHCEALPESMVPDVALAQQARDAMMGHAMLRADRGGGAVLVAGAGHARKDRGVPVTLRAARGGAVVSIAWIEVVRGEDAPDGYLDRLGAEVAPYDFVWFTPRVDEADPCAALAAPVIETAASSGAR
jgi:uncharacterized iron-regulated protein